MLFPHHPQPVARRRAVAAMIVTQAPRAAIEAGHVLVVPAAALRPVVPRAEDAPANPA